MALMRKYINCDTLFVVAGVVSGSAASSEGIIPGDKILAINGHCSEDINGKDNAQEALKHMVDKTTKLVIRRGGLIKFFDLQVTKFIPSGLKIADGKIFEEWLPKLRLLAKVQDVAEGSPAEEAGLEKGDEIIWCNTITFQSKDAFPNLLIQIKNSEDNNIIFYVRKYRGDIEQLVATPRKWASGKGLTGMSITPH